ncbi:MAG: F0F1 ATP synthase subunit A [Clostridiales bacterium]|nr:MAG: F0F1 ATP synthase subunit A [Clostridiales bacterium]
MVHNLVTEVMGEKNLKNSFRISARFFTLSILGSLSSLLGMRPLTADLSTTLGWALVTFMMVQITNIKTNGIFGYIKSFTQPVAVLTPLNLISEVANPISIAFRHFGNIASGVVITSLVYSALAALSNFVLGFIPNDFIKKHTDFFQVGLPALLSVYFDLFTSFLQAYIISMLTMVFLCRRRLNKFILIFVYYKEEFFYGKSNSFGGVGSRRGTCDDCRYRSRYRSGLRGR